MIDDRSGLSVRRTNRKSECEGYENRVGCTLHEANLKEKSKELGVFFPSTGTVRYDPAQYSNVEEEVVYAV